MDAIFITELSSHHASRCQRDMKEHRRHLGFCKDRGNIGRCRPSSILGELTILCGQQDMTVLGGGELKRSVHIDCCHKEDL